MNTHTTHTTHLQVIQGLARSEQEFTQFMRAYHGLIANNNPNQSERVALSNLQTLISHSKSPSEFNQKLMCFQAFGHLYSDNPSITLQHSYCVHGQPALNATAMLGIVRSYRDETGEKVCGYIRFSEISDEQVTMCTRRRDELEFDIPEHQITFSMRDAERMGFLKSRNNNNPWIKMPKNMMMARATSFLCRAFYADVIGQSYSPDELADNMNLSDHERDTIISASVMGERPSKPQPQPQLQAQPEPQPEPHPQRSPEPQYESEPQHKTQAQVDQEIEQRADEMTAAYDPHWTKDFELTKREVEQWNNREQELNRIMQMLPQSVRVRIWEKHHGHAQPIPVILGNVPMIEQIELLSDIPF